jgi:diguanylate cyclase (GGDEF)-like protein
VDKPKGKKLFLNVDANIIHDKEFRDGITLKRLEEYGLQPKDIIFEITERTAIEDLKTFQDSVDHYKNQDFMIAIDDVGSGYSGLNRICAVSPSLLKIDMAIVRGIDKDTIKQSLVMGIVQFCQDAEISLVAEGIETEGECETLIQLGVSYGQGYYLGRPDNELKELPKPLVEKISKTYQNGPGQLNKNSFFGTIETICSEKECFHISARAIDIYEKMRSDTSYTEACIIDDKAHAVGVITRANMLQIFSGRYGYNLHAKKTVEKIMSQDFLAVDLNTSIEVVSKMALDRPDDKIYDSVLVTKQGKFYGTVTIKDVLQTAIKIQVNRAVDSNPLTGLPGNREIEKKILECLGHKKAFSIVYIDIDNFKAYNDTYGFNNGDLMIQTLSDSIKEACSCAELKGHIGGDDFVLVFHEWEVEHTCKQIINLFKEGIKLLYTDEDWEKGFIYSKNRNGIEERFPIASLSISAVTNQTTQFHSMNEFSKTIASIKKQCKQREGNYIMIV